MNLDDYLEYNRVTVCTVQLAVGNGLALQEYAKVAHKSNSHSSTINVSR
jgi:hypothetical protein